MKQYHNMERPVKRRKGKSTKKDRALNGNGMKKSDFSLVRYTELPSFLQDNEFLLDSHRPQLNSIKRCIKSIFTMHTETLNIWTHFLGSLGVVFLSLYYLGMVSELWHQHLAMGIFFTGAVICLGLSTIYHTLVCHSEPYCRFWAKMDYCGVVVLIVSSFVPWVHFGFYCTLYLKPLYLGLAFTLGLLAMVVVAAERFRGGKYRTLRAGVFIALGLTGAAPGLHYIFTHDLWPHVTFYGWLIFMAVLYIAGGVIYAMRVPERIWPGKFDIWCHSHQILHLCVIGGVLTSYKGASRLADFRVSVDPECPASLSVI